jgi:4-carboxymuconolactone decarboxylase
MTDDDVHQKLRQRGRKNMERILGVDYLAKRDASTNSLNAALRHLSEEFAYGTVWEGPEFDARQRSMLTIALLCALNRPVELRLHVAAGLRNGLTAAEISAVVTHSAAYCGIPAAIDAMRVLEEVAQEALRS